MEMCQRLRCLVFSIVEGEEVTCLARGPCLIAAPINITRLGNESESSPASCHALLGYLEDRN